MISQRQADISKDERGAMLMEYGMLFVLVVVVAIMAMAAFGVSVLELYTSNAEQFDAAVRPSIG